MRRRTMRGMRIDFKPDPDLFPFTSRFYESPVGRIHYIDEGSGIPILLLHGNPMWSFLYRKIVPLLRDDFRCVAVDYPGFGLSDRPEEYGYTPAEHALVIGKLVDHLDLDGFLITMQDWGGPIGLTIARERGDRVRGLVMGNTWFWPLQNFMTKFFSKAMSTGFMQRQVIEKNFFVERLMPKAMSTKLTKAEMDHYRNAQPTPSARVGVAEFPRQILAAEPLLMRLSQDVPRVLGSKPALLVWGMKDFVFRPKIFIPRMRRTFSDHQITELPDAKHYIQEDAPQEVADAIRKRFS
jgi:haloalkane dehalogenase